MTHIPRIFLSSSSADLHIYREHARDTILRVGGLPILIDENHRSDNRILQYHYDKIQEADGFIGLYAYSYGDVPGYEVVYQKTDHTTSTGDNKTSIAQWEYQWALERGLPIFLFMINPDEDSNPPADRPPEFIEEGAGQARLREFKRALMNKHTVGIFKSPDDLARQVATALAGLLIPQSASPRRFKGYELQEVIGAGGYGMVYRAQQTAVDRQVAIKLILPEHTNQPDFIRGFEAEAQLIARLEHPYIVPLFDYWRDADSTCLVMRFMRGGSISQYINGQPLPVDDVLRWVEQIGAALAFAHRHGVIHRDLKPDNLLLDEEGNAYLSDFGIARPTGYRSNETSITGTMAYIAPDQLKGEPPTPQADLYSFGIVLYELLTGTHPFAGQTPSQLVMSHLATPLPDITHVRPELSPIMRTVIGRATAKDPRERYSDARELTDAFHQALNPAIRPLESPASGAAPINVELTNPYKGLRAFQEYDEGDFFGRETLVEQFIERMRQPEEGRLLVVVGPSGSGKSSAVKAGLIPALRRGALPGSENWFITEMMPGSQPLEELEAALLRVAINPPANMPEQLKESEDGLCRALDQILPPDDTELLLVIDQFEELFTLTNDEAQRVHLLNSLLTALDDPQARLRIVLTLRADFYDKPLYYLDFGTRLRKSVETVLPLSPAELEQSIMRPAEQAGAVLENGLVSAILQEINDQPGILPLLQYALTELFERRHGLMLTFKAYHAMGGVTGALGQRAEALYAALDETGQEAVRQVFLRLISLGEGTEDTRRRVRQSEFAPSALPVIQRFGEARLLTSDRDPQTRGPTVEVAHEALLRTWQRLKDWIAAVRDEVSIHRRLSHATEEWLRTNRDSGFLAREAPLEQFESWSQTTTLSLNDMEQSFLDASLGERAQRQTLDLARKAQEAQTARRAQNLGRAAAVFAVTGFLAIVLTVFAFVRTRQLEDTSVALNAQGTQASLELTSIYGEGEGQREQILSFSLVNAARRVLAGGDRPLAMHLALLAASRPGLKFPIDLSVEQAFHEVVYSFGQRKTLVETDSHIEIMAFHQEKGLAALGLRNGTVEVRNMLTGVLKTSVRPETPAVVYTLAFNKQGTKLAYALENQTLWVLDLTTETPKPVKLSPASPTYTLYTVAFSPDGKYLVTGGNDAQVRVLDARTGVELSVQRAVDPIDSTKGQGPVFSIVFTPDGRQVITGGAGAEYALNLWHIERDGSGKTSLIHDGTLTDSNIGAVTSIAVFQDRSGAMKIATASTEKIGVAVRLWDVVTGTPSSSDVEHTDLIYSIAFSQDGKYLVSGSADMSMRLWDVTTGTLQLIGNPWLGHNSTVTGVAFNKDDKFVISGSFDRTMRLWDAVIPQETTPSWRGKTGSDLLAVATSPDSTRVVAVSADGTVQLWDASGQTIAAIHLPAIVTAVAFRPDNREVVMGTRHGDVYSWDMEGPAPAAALLIDKLDDEYSAVWNLVYTPDARSILMGMGTLNGSHGRLEIWDVETKTLEVLKMDVPDVRALVISPPRACPGGLTCFAVGMQDGTIELWDLATRELITTFNREHADVVLDLAFSPAGKCPISRTEMGTCLVSGSADRTLNIWNLATGTVIGENLVGHTYWVNSVMFSPDGRYVISASEDKTLRLWDTSTHASIGQPWVGHALGIDAITFAPNGQDVMSVSKDGTLRFWALRTMPEMIAWACQNRYARPIAAEDMVRYGVQEDITPNTCPAIDPNPPIAQS